MYKIRYCYYFLRKTPHYLGGAGLIAKANLTILLESCAAGCANLS
jgi:hypothetical protein